MTNTNPDIEHFYWIKLKGFFECFSSPDTHLVCGLIARVPAYISLSRAQKLKTKDK